ncbi:ArsR/SmtB family transcription factor [Paenibacillus sp. VTT E-133280]|uniref:ArsR/SmtB family transcription factor n=1 Tax=Paenibacillus sp. VTT E-133280 TaxID=1986222 RepID=UPI0027BB157C|nr:helix-turn-helix domain-containing protein [Paenibacillus sp. VTT E-133280]
MDYISQSPKSVKGLAKNTQMTVANVSQHLQTLHNAKLVSFKKQGNFVFYELADSSIIDFIRTLHSLSEKQLVQVQLIQKNFKTSIFRWMDCL